MKKPKFKPGDRVVLLCGSQGIGEIDRVEWSYAYHLKGEIPSLLWQEDELRPLLAERVAELDAARDELRAVLVRLEGGSPLTAGERGPFRVKLQGKSRKGAK